MEITQEDLDRAIQVFTADPDTYAKAAEHAFRKNAKAAAEEIAKIALYAESDKTRLDACKYITDRVLGRIKEREQTSNDKEPWEGIFGTVTREPTAEERASQTKH
jgi:hypothetical protein